GMVRVKGDLDPENGETVLTAIQALVDAELRATGGRDLRSPSQRRADALAELARRYLDSGESSDVAGERPDVTVTVDLESLRANAGMALADHVGAIHAHAARRIACDASITRVVMDGESQPLEVGRRTRVVPASIRRAVVLRDKQCRFPGC